MKLSLATFLVMLPLAAVAEDDKIDCTDPQVQIELNYCAEQSFLAADAELNDIYKAAMAAMKEIDGYLPEDQRGAAAALKTAQRNWIPYRDDACQAEGYLVSGGSMLGLVINECLERLTRQRIGDLTILVEGMGN
ncbi:lysozyme inhibitor LprI family protein [Microbaculum marinisediminis]|uniref:DUF1311 domain-containing protein n=1 Tax=Microbaculum marinisediminis TaxID=2931392 RepID=A0AAW5QXC9_9HYPH|nr:DUF1311 domain-containing protein [Microbaculum sp. A6E488]MCT8971549.1 DUF1311 domain-containing protein [Microbaculum sp. A6E488]